MPGPNRFTEGLIDFADVVATSTASNGVVLANVGDATNGTGIDRSVAFWGIDGFLSRPIDPDANGSAQYLFFCDGNARHAIGSRDRRFPTGLEDRDPGDRMIYGPSGIRIRLDDSEQAIEQSIPGGTKHYVSSDLYFVAMQAGTKIEMDDSTCDVTKLGTAEPVALYERLQAVENAFKAWVDAAQVALAALLVTIEPPPTFGPITIALNTSYTALGISVANATNPLLASSTVLRASPT